MHRTLLLLALFACDHQVTYEPFDEADTDTDTDTDADTDTDTDTDADTDTDPADPPGWTTDDPTDTYAWASVDAAEFVVLDGAPIAGLHDLEVFGDTVFGLSGSALWLSHDDGLTWERRSPPAGFDVARSLALTHDGWFVSTADGISRSTDDGLTWVTDASVVGVDLVTDGLQLLATTVGGTQNWAWDGTTWSAFTVPVDSPSFAIDGGSLYAAGWLDEVHRSNDAGLTWTALGGQQIAQLHGAQNGELFGLDVGGQLVSSTDDGLSWQVLGIHPDPFTERVFRHQGRLWVAKNGEGLVSSEDEGATWAPDAPGLPDDSLTKLFRDVVVTPAGNVLAASASADTWRRTTGDFSRVQDGFAGGTVTSMHLKDDLLLAAVGQDLWLFDGTSWSPFLLDGLRRPGAIGSSGDALLVETLDGLFRTEDWGQTWTAVGTNLPDTIGSAGREALRLSNLETRGTWLFAGLDAAWSASSEGGFSTPSGGGVVVSWDEGATWDWATWDLPVQETNAWGAPVYDDGTIVRAYADQVLLGTRSTGLWVSEDQGDSWVSATGLPAGQVEQIARASSGTYAVLRHDDGTRTLHASGDGLVWTVDPLGIPGAGALTLIDADGALFVFTDGEDAALWRRDATRWHSVATVPEGILARAPVLQDGEVFYVTAVDRGLLELRPLP